MESYSIAQLTSLPAVVAAAVFLTYLAKRLLGGVPVAARIPTWVYTATIAGALAFIANRIVGSLPGQTGMVVIDAIIYGAVASGIRTWVVNFGAPIEDSGTARKAAIDARFNAHGLLLPFLLAGSMLTGGCALLGPGDAHDRIAAEQVQQVRAQALKIAKAVESVGQLVVEARRATGAAYEARLISLEQRNAVYQAIIDLEPRAHAVIDIAATVTTDPQLRSTVTALMGLMDDLLERLAQGNAAMVQVSQTIRVALNVATVYLGGGQ